MDRRSSIASMEQDHSSSISVEKRDKNDFPQTFIELIEDDRVLKDMSDFLFLIHVCSIGSIVV